MVLSTLLQLAESALARMLVWGHGSELPDLAAMPELEHAMAVYRQWQKCLAQAALPPPPPSPLLPGPPPQLARQHAVLQAFAAAFWRPQLLRLAYAAGAVPQGLVSLHLVAARLEHVELSAPGLLQLEGIAAACPCLRCLSLRGCTQLGDASLAALGRCTTLTALDLGGLAALSDGAAFHVAKLPSLAAVSLSGTAVTDRALELLAYGHRVRAWQRAAAAPQLPPEAAPWPAPPLEHLQLAGTAVGPEGVAQLEVLPSLR